MLAIGVMTFPPAHTMAIQQSTPCILVFSHSPHSLFALNWPDPHGRNKMPLMMIRYRPTEKLFNSRIWIWGSESLINHDFIKRNSHTKSVSEGIIFT